MPRRVHVTGGLDAHDIGIGSNGAPIFVNTKFNCLATVAYSANVGIKLNW